MRATNRRLTILSQDEQLALYALPDFNYEQRQQFFQFTDSEQDIIYKRKSISDKIYCALQIGYFKAKDTFFDFGWSGVPPEDSLFILEHYLPDSNWTPEAVSRHEFYLQRKAISICFGYVNWNTATHKLPFMEHLESVIKRDATLQFILPEALSWFKVKKIIRPGYTTLQSLISTALGKERSRLELLIKQQITEDTKSKLDALLATDTTLSELAALKQDAKDFKYRMMQSECAKLKTLRPLYQLANCVLPSLAISQQNIDYYASLAHFYTATELMEFSAEQRGLYLLCFVWQRYQKITDNLVTAFCYHIKHFDDSLKVGLSNHRIQKYKQQRKQAKKVAKLLDLFIDDSLDDIMPYGKIRKKAFKILPKEAIIALSVKFSELNESEQAVRWKIFDTVSSRFRRHLRPLFLQLDLIAEIKDNQWAQAIQTIKQRFNNQQQLSIKDQQLVKLVPKRLANYLLSTDNDKNTTINPERYEYWFYRQCREQLLDGNLYLNDSVRHRSFESELLTNDATAAALKHLTVGKFQEPIGKVLDELEQELNSIWPIFDRKLKKDEFKHLQYDKARDQLSTKKIIYEKDPESQDQFYRQLPACNIINVLQFVNEQCGFLQAFTPLQSRYAKKIPVENELFAVIMSQAMNHGLNTMADISDTPYYILQHNYKQFFREATLEKANDLISDATSKLPIFQFYDHGFSMRYGAVDGQKFSVAHPTTKSRSSKKYFGRGKGVVAYTYLCNHVPLKSYVISAHDHESNYTFDVSYNNTSTIAPEAISGDMHSTNKANFLLFFWFGLMFHPRFTDLDSEIRKVCCATDESEYDKFSIKPSGKYNRKLIEDEWPNLQRILVTLAQKEITQEVLIKKLCTYSSSNRTRQALFEFDKLVRSIYTLKYIMDPQLQQQVHHSQNRLEAYHQLRGAVAQVGGKKELTGKTDIEVEISNQCGRLVSNAIIYYNSAILSKLLEFYQATNNENALAELYKFSPVAWQHIYLIGKYIFDNSQSGIDLTTVLADLISRLAA